MSGPSAAESVVETVRDAVNLSLRASCAGFGDQAVPTSVTRAMNVEKRNAFTFVEPPSFDVEQLAADLLQTSDGDVSRNQWIRHTCKAALMQVNIGAANFRDLDLQ